MGSTNPVALVTYGTFFAIAIFPFVFDWLAQRKLNSIKKVYS